MSQHRCVRVLRWSVAKSACARGTPVGWVAFLRIILAAPRGAEDRNAVAKGVEKIRDEMMVWAYAALRFPMAWSQCRESQCACVHQSDGAAVPPRAGYVIDSDVDEEVNKCVWHRSYSCRALER